MSVSSCGQISTTLFVATMASYVVVLQVLYKVVLVHLSSKLVFQRLQVYVICIYCPSEKLRLHIVLLHFLSITTVDVFDSVSKTQNKTLYAVVLKLLSNI